MSFSSLFANILPSIGEGWNDNTAPAAGNMGSFIYNVFKFFREMAEGLKSFFSKTITVGGETYSIWLAFGGVTIGAILILVIIKKITPLV